MKQLAWIFVLAAASAQAAPDGAAIYQKLCVRCHGPQGEGVPGECEEPLRGKRSVESLTRYIDRYMPEEAPEKCQGEDAAAVAAWMHQEFYAGTPKGGKEGAAVPRVQLSRLTNEQFRQSVADLFGSFRGRPGNFAGGGLQAQYFNAEQMEERKAKLVERVDAQVMLDDAVLDGVEKLKRGSFSVQWNGSLLVPVTGDYGFRVITPNGVRVFLNALPWREGREEVALIDAWVSSGEEPRTEEARVFLTGGRAYPLRVRYLCYGQKTASLRFEWKAPDGVWEPVPAELLSNAWAPPTAVVATDFPPDDASHGYERGIAVSQDWLDALARAATELATYAAYDIDALARTKPGAPDRVERIKEFCAAFAERAFRRPLAGAERQGLLAEFANQPPDVAVRRIVTRVLCSPRFLYPVPPGAPEDDHTVAARLALALWDSLPDEPLRKAAAAGELRARARLEEQARRMLEDPRARHKLGGFFDRWLGLGHTESLSKDPAVFPEFDEHLVADALASLERFVDEVVWGERSDFRELLLADYLFVNGRLAAYYGLPAPEGDGFSKVAAPAGQRAGVVTHPYLMASLAYYRSSSPIHRGVHATRNLLGRSLKPPPEAIEFMDDRFDPSLSMREKVTQLTGKPACMSCHEIINPLGFALENFDATGRWRHLDGGKPVDATGTYTTLAGETVNLTGPRDLANHAAASREAAMGFVLQLFQHAAKQAPQAYGSRMLDDLTDSFAADGFHIRNLLVRIAATAAQPQPPATS